MKTIIIGHALKPGKTAIATALTKADTYRIGAEWRSAQELAHNTAVEEVKHFGRHTTLKGEVLWAEAPDSPATQVQILDIRLVEPARLTEADFQALGYANRADYMADWGDILGDKIWLMRIKQV